MDNESKKKGIAKRFSAKNVHFNKKLDQNCNYRLNPILVYCFTPW